MRQWAFVSAIHALLAQDGGVCRAELVVASWGARVRARGTLEHSACLKRPRPSAHAPQVNLPIAEVEGLPVGLGLIGPPGSDEDLLQLTERLMALLRPA